MSNLATVPFKGTKEQEEKLREVIRRHKDEDGAAIPVLHEAQDIYGYLPIEVQKIISEGLNVPLAEIYGIVTFYTQFSLYPKGEYEVSVCLGTACYVKGSGTIIEKIRERLGIDVGQCTPDGKFSLNATRCIGACGLAPVMTVNDAVFGQVKPADLDDIFAKYQG